MKKRTAEVPPNPRLLTGWGALGLAVGGGWIWSLQFEAEALRWSPWLALIPLLLLLESKRPGRWSWVYGAVFWVAAIPWIVPTLVDYGAIPVALAWPLMIGVGFYLGSYWALFGWVGARFWQRGGWSRLLTVPSLWTVLEWLRGVVSDFPWNLAAYAVIEVPGSLPLSAWIGSLGVSWIVVFANVAVLQLCRQNTRLRGATALPVVALLLILGGRWGGAEDRLVPSGGGGEVRVVQPNIPNRLVVDSLTFEEIERLASMSAEACDAPGALVVWPESAGWPLQWDRDSALRQVVERTTRRGCSVLFNSTTDTEAGPYNSAYLVTPSGAAGRYDKRRLVPFGEYVPLRGLFPFIDSLARNAGQYEAAEGIELLPWAGEEIGTAICFEVTFDSEVAASVQQGATVLATLTNDAWYGDSSAPWQHLRAARFRAAENRRPLVRAAITGVSAVIDGRGQLVDTLGVGEEGVISVRVRGRRDLGLYSRLPALIPTFAGLIVLLSWGVPLLRSRAD